MLNRRYQLVALAAAVVVPPQIPNSNAVEYHPNLAPLPLAQPVLQAACLVLHLRHPALPHIRHNCPPKWTNTLKNLMTRA